MSSVLVISLIVIYLLGMFGIAYWAEKNTNSKWVNNPYIYTLSLAVYCTAWTYYGSVGLASTSGIVFLTIYLGPIIIIPTWIFLMRKVIRISKGNKISSIADFISLRYGNNRFLGALVTVVSLSAIIPYISLQLKAISETYNVITDTNINSSSLFGDTTFYIAILLALFATFFGTQKTDASEKHKGIITAIAVESIVKLVFFLVIGIYVTFYLFNGPQDLYQQASQLPGFDVQQKIEGIEGGLNWFFLSTVSLFAIMLLPRQFQVTVVENQKEKHLKTAIWLFPLYLMLFNVFVLFIAWGGNIMFYGKEVDVDFYALLIPMANHNNLLALIVFFGGFSASISMVVVSTLALSTMVSNNLIIPYGIVKKFERRGVESNVNTIKKIRRASIFLLIVTAYLFYKFFVVKSTLVSIGLISFVIIAQLGPAFFGGLIWKRGTYRGVKFGIFFGIAISIYTLIIPFTIHALSITSTFTTLGPFGIEFLKPYSFFGMTMLDPIPHAFFWSMFFNIFVYSVVSVSKMGDYRERNFAEMFVSNINYHGLKEGDYVWKGKAYVKEIREMMNRIIGEEKTSKEIELFFKRHDLPNDIQMADAKFINFSEKLLTGVIGSASSKLLLSNVVEEEKISLFEVLDILEETKRAKESNYLLKEKSDQLKKMADEIKANNIELREKDKQKDDFLGTVTHELKTPITSIRSLSEILIDHDDVDLETKKKFLRSILDESDRVTRLINNVLDLEKLASQKAIIETAPHNISDTISKTVETISQLPKNENIDFITKGINDTYINYDEDKISQVLINLISNAAKFVNKDKGIIEVGFYVDNDEFNIYVKDNGKGIEEEELKLIFDKFYQAKNQNVLKPEGSGLGLAISKQIVSSHGGKIWAEKNNSDGVIVKFTLPIKNVTYEV